MIVVGVFELPHETVRHEYKFFSTGHIERDCFYHRQKKKKNNISINLYRRVDD